MKHQINLSHSDIVDLIKKNLNGVDLNGKNVSIEFKTTRKPLRVSAVVFIEEDSPEDHLDRGEVTQEPKEEVTKEEPEKESDDFLSGSSVENPFG